MRARCSNLCNKLMPLIGGVIALTILSGMQSAMAQSRPFNIPDLSSYNCASVNAATAAGVRHMGQVINGRYHEWHEIYAEVGGSRRLACISLIVPEARQMSVGEARAFLKDASNVGAPEANATSNNERPQAFQQNITEPQNVKPMPLKRAIKPTPLPGANEKPANRIEIPPIPAIKSFKKAGFSPPNENDHSATAPLEALFSFMESDKSPVTVGVEDRAVVSNTLTYPWNTIGYLVATFPSGNSFRCSGTLVSAYVVLTAGHCIHDNSEGGFLNAAFFFPGRYQSPPGSNTVSPYSNSDLAFVKTTQTWTEISGEDSYAATEYRYDFAAVQFDTPFTYTGTFIPVVFQDTTNTVTSAGYPASVNGQSVQTQYFDEGATTSSSSSLQNSAVREFAIDASGGNSGGPFFATDQFTAQRRLVGILSYGDGVNDEAGGPWYSSFNQSLVSDWMSYTPEGAVSSTEGLRVAAVFSSDQLTSQSFLRFYNAGSAAGTVDVTLANYVSGEVLGTWTSSTIDPGAELQFYIKDIENGADQPFAIPAFYSVSIRSTFSGYFQHVLWRPADGTLTNLSTCDSTTTSDTRTVIGAHSSLLDNGYPSTLIVHNTGVDPVNIQFTMYDARNGNRLGTFTSGTIDANGQKLLNVSDAEESVFPPFNPASNMYHYVIKADSQFSGYIQLLVDNQAAGVITDMTAVCTLTASG